MTLKELLLLPLTLYNCIFRQQSFPCKQDRRHLRIRATIDDLSPRFRITFCNGEISVEYVFVEGSHPN